MSRANLWTFILLILGVVASGVAVVHAKYLTRTEFGRLQDLRVQRDAIDVEWNRLRLEEAAHSTHALVERKAREELGMFLPRPGDVLLLEEAPHASP